MPKQTNKKKIRKKASENDKRTKRKVVLKCRRDDLVGVYRI